MKKYELGCKILIITSFLFIAIGIYGVLFNNTSLFTIINWIMDTNWDSEIPSKSILDFKIFAWDFIGMFHIIWGINIYFVVKYGLINRKEAWAWKCILISVITWLVVDIYYTLTINRNTFILVTIFFALLFLIPLIMTKEVLNRK